MSEDLSWIARMFGRKRNYGYQKPDLSGIYKIQDMADLIVSKPGGIVGVANFDNDIINNVLANREQEYLFMLSRIIGSAPDSVDATGYGTVKDLIRAMKEVGSDRDELHVCVDGAYFNIEVKITEMPNAETQPG